MVTSSSRVSTSLGSFSQRLSVSEGMTGFWRLSFCAWLQIAVLASAVCLFSPAAWSQERITDQVAVTVSKDRLLGIHRGEGIARIPLSAGEQILRIRTKGITGFVHTSGRLLGYSGVLQRWSEQSLDISEQVNASYVTPRLILVLGAKHVFGFQGEIGRWKVHTLGPRESILRAIVQDHVAVLITNNQVLGFSAFTGGFFAKDLPLTYDDIKSEANDNIVILTLNNQQLLFRSGLAIWTELR